MSLVYAQWVFNWPYLPFAVALLGAGISTYTDIRWGKIKNLVTFPLIVFGWAWSYLAGGLNAMMINIFLSSIIGALATRIGKLGAGDIKLIVGITACLRSPLNFLFLAFFYMVMAASAVFIRFKLYGFKLKPAVQKMKTEILMELGGVQDAGTTVHGERVRHLGGPVIFAALVFTLLKTVMGGMMNW